MSAAQFRKIANGKKISKANMARIEKGLDPIESEESAQIRLIQFLEELKKDGKITLFTSIPNSTRTPYQSVRNKNILTGLRKGLPDLMILYPTSQGNRTLWIELKIETGGKRSPEQQEWIFQLQKTEGADAYFAEGYEEAKNRITEVLYFYGQ